MKQKTEQPIVGHIGLIHPALFVQRRRRKRTLSTEEKEKLIAQAKTAYEIRVAPTTRASY